MFGFADRRRPVTPAKAGVQPDMTNLGSCLRRNDMPEDMCDMAGPKRVHPSPENSFVVGRPRLRARRVTAYHQARE
jgi:hypothetical protein